MTNTSTRAEIRKAEKAARQAELVRGQVIIALMGETSGRQYVHDILAEAHVFHAIPPTDANLVFFQLGERNQALRLFDDILQHCPEQFIQMMREETARARRDLDDAVRDDADRAEPNPGADVYGDEA